MTAPNWKVRTPRDKKYKAWIERQPCCLKGRKVPCMGDVVGHHESEPGHNVMGGKVSDYRMLPLCYQHHRLRHDVGRSVFGDIDVESLMLNFKQTYDMIQHSKKCS